MSTTPQEHTPYFEPTEDEKKHHLLDDICKRYSESKQEVEKFKQNVGDIQEDLNKDEGE